MSIGTRYCLGLPFSFFFLWKNKLIAEFSLHFYCELTCISFLLYFQTTVSQSTLFDHLINIWEFRPGPVPGTCDLYFLVDFKFQSPLYSQVWFFYHLFHLVISTCFLVSLCFRNQSLLRLCLHFLFSSTEPCMSFIFCVC
jgi:hypothetical protein